MSFDDYANHIYEKHRLAVALAIIKSKPAKVKTKTYLEELKSKIDHKMDDDDITICSDDFLIEDDDEMNDSVTILKDLDPELVNNNEHFPDDNAASKKPPIQLENQPQITYYENSQQHATCTAVSLTDISLYQANQNLDIELSIPNNVASKDFNNRTSNIDHNLEMANKSSPKTKDNNRETANVNNKPVAVISNDSMNVTYYDSQKTIPYTLHGFTQNYTHYSPSQNDIVIPNKYLFGVNNKNASNTNQIIFEEKHTTVVNSNELKTQFVSKGNSLDNNTDTNPKNREEFEFSQTMNIFSQRNDDNFDEIRNINAHLDSKSHTTLDDINQDLVSKDIQNSTQYSNNVEKYFKEIQLIEENDNRNSFPNEMNTNNSVNHSEIVEMDVTEESVKFDQNIDYFSQNQEISYSKNVSEKAINTPNVNEHNQLTNTSIFEEKHSQNSKRDYQFATPSAENDSSAQTNRKEEYRIAEEEYEPEEIISYKVLEEFNKIKSFLSRQNRRMSCDGYSTDSGYRSDSQRSNRSALQLSGNWLNQSGCCLFNYIMQCPLVAATRDITNEIAQVLSQLIDRLHEEEKYPSFLEELLETIDLLLRQVHQGESSTDNEFLKKDEYIQRILLLNKSIHIQKHTIEKMTYILEIFHTKVTETDSTYELSNIDEVENITYIFHLLEILLKKHLKNREISSQNTQNSQEDEKIFKKTSITDIWRKKWNPSQKVFEGNREKKCVLKNCSEILNRIVVDCVSNYSLISYSALKCFNCMQT